jgi:hypothetical protein
MASNKQLIVATVDLIPQSGPAEKAIRILRKRVPGATYGSADLANKSFAFHQIESGAVNSWARGAGTVDGSLQVRLTSMEEDPPPTTPDPVNPDQVVEQLQIDGNGLVSAVSNQTFKGFLTADKTTVFMVSTFVETGTSYEMLAISLVNQGKSFTLADLEGTFRLHAIWSGSPGWAYGDLVMGATGGGSFDGIDPPTGVEAATLTITAGGAVAWANYPSFKGTLSSNGSLLIATETDGWGNGEFSLEFYVK